MPFRLAAARSAALAAALALPLAAVAQEPYPSQPVTVIVPFAPGGNLDVSTRIVATSMAKTLGQPVVVDNRAGAGGIVGHEAAARARPNGYTLVTTANGSFAVTPRMQAGRVPFKAADFTPVGMIAVTPLVLEVPSASRFRNVAELLAHARANPGTVSIGHPGNGTTNHVAILQLQEATGVRFTVVPFKGSGPALTDLLGGQIDAMVDQLPSSLAHLQAGKLRALAVTTPTRAADLPQVPTLAESGLADFDVSTTIGLLAPAGTPAAVVARLHGALNDALREPAVEKRLRELGAEPRPLGTAQFAEFLQREDAKAEAMARKGLLRSAD